MPTGYTYKVKNGEIADFPTFALECARGFGAMVTLRENPDAPIPEVFEPSDHYAKLMERRRGEVARLYSMTLDEAAIACAAEHKAAVARHAERLAERTIERQRYEAMMEQVLRWVPPTPEHRKLRSFMQEQLRTSIDFDCPAESEDEPKPVKASPEVWLAKARAEADRSLSYASEEHAKEVERAANRTAWVSALRRSLTPEQGR